MTTLTRRALLGGMAALALSTARTARGLGRTPLGGRITMHLPWPTASIDPHDLRDPAAALFGPAIADPVYALDASGNPYPSLAAGMPIREGDRTVVRLREGLVTARLVPLLGVDLVKSLERARARGGAPILAELPAPKPHPSDPTAVVFGSADPARVARVLASPLLALLPRRFDPGSPDGTGPFRAETGTSRLRLVRNVHAARGHAFLDSVEVERATDLKTSLRAFEAGSDDIGWLGLGLFDGRKDATRFDFGKVAWVILATGAEAGSFGQHGVAQRLCDAMPSERLAHLSLGGLPRASGDSAWGGPPCDLVVDESCAHLVEIARTVAPILSRPGHEVSAAPVPRAEVARRRARDKAALVLDLVRPVGDNTLSAFIALATADDASRARDLVLHPPKLAPGATPRTVTSTLRVGVLGELRVTGGVAPDVVLARAAGGDGWDLGATWRRPPR